MSSKKELRFDPVLLDSMDEPLTVRVEKIKGGNRMPIDLPARDTDLPSGMGWDRNSVRRLETWLVNDWAGGGLYHIMVADPSGRKMEWQALYDPRQFPEMIPHTMQANISQPATRQAPAPVTQAPAQPAPQQGASAPMNGGMYAQWPPPGYVFAQTPVMQAQPAPQPQAQPQPQQGPMAMPWTFMQPPSIMQAAPPAPAPAAPTPPPTSSIRASMMEDLPRRRTRFDEDDMERKQLEQRARDLEERVRQSEKDRLEADYKAQLEKTRQESERQLEELRRTQTSQAEALKEELRRMREVQQQPAANNPELDAIREARAKLEQDHAKLERERERDLRDAREAREREETNRKFQELQNLIARMADQPKAAVGPDPAVIAMQEQQRALQEELRRERERAEQDRREREREERERLSRETLKEEIRRREEDAKRREDLLMAQISEVKNNANRGPDPLFTMMQESTRQQFDALKEMMRTQQASSERMQNQSLSTKDLIALMKEKDSGLDEIKKGVVDVYKDVFEIQRSLVEQAAQFNQSGDSPTMRIVEAGIGRASELADRYFKTKRDEVVSNAKVQAAQVEAQAQQAQAFAMHQARIADAARREEMLRQQAAQQAQAAQAAQAGGLHGTGAAAAAAVSQAQAQPQQAQAPKPPKIKKVKAEGEKAKAQPIEQVQPIDQGTTDPETGATIAKIIPLRRLGKTDEEWFGDAFDHVKNLRAAVAEFVKSLQAEPKRIDPKTGKIVGAGPEQCIEFLIRAVNFILAQNIEVPAVKVLFMEDRFAELLDILIPEAPQGYRDDCVQLLYMMAEEAQKDQADPEVDDVDDEDEDEDDEDDGEDDDEED